MRLMTRSNTAAINFTAEKPDLHLPISQRAPELPESSRPVSPALFVSAGGIFGCKSALMGDNLAAERR
jgi:hypothetical protein